VRVVAGGAARADSVRNGLAALPRCSLVLVHDAARPFATADLARAVALRPRWGEAWADLGWTRSALGDTEQARRDLARAVALDPTHIGVGLAQAEFFARTAGAGPAVEELRRLRQANPSWTLDPALTVALRWTRDRTTLATLTDGSPEQSSALDVHLARR
jgi:tetratricopeptide (TPR) repeat protein